MGSPPGPPGPVEERPEESKIGPDRARFFHHTIFFTRHQGRIPILFGAGARKRADSIRGALLATAILSGGPESPFTLSETIKDNYFMFIIKK